MNLSTTCTSVTTTHQHHAVVTHVNCSHKGALYLQKLLNGGQIRLAMQAIFFQVVVLVQGTCLDELEQSAGHVGVLVQHLLALCQLRQAADGTHQVTCVGLHDLIGVSCGVHICPCPPV